MRDYREAYGQFSMSQLARDVLRGSLADGVSAAIECCDRWADRGRIALNWIDREFAEKA